MVYTYKMWDEDGRQISEGLYETGARPVNRLAEPRLGLRCGREEYFTRRKSYRIYKTSH